jgi:hypothetical protein
MCARLELRVLRDQPLARRRQQGLSSKSKASGQKPSPEAENDVTQRWCLTVWFN